MGILFRDMVCMGVHDSKDAFSYLLPMLRDIVPCESLIEEVNAVPHNGYITETNKLGYMILEMPGYKINATGKKQRSH